MATHTRITPPALPVPQAANPWGLISLSIGVAVLACETLLAALVWHAAQGGSETGIGVAVALAGLIPLMWVGVAAAIAGCILAAVGFARASARRSNLMGLALNLALAIAVACGLWHFFGGFPVLMP